MNRRVGATLVAFAVAASACSSDSGSRSAPPLVTSSTSTAGDTPDEQGQSQPGDTPDEQGQSQPGDTPDEQGQSQPGDTSDRVEVIPSEIRQIDCPPAIAGNQLACGTATVALDRSDPAAGTAEITIATMQGSDPAFDMPLVVLQGGPGGASTELAAWFPQQAFTQVFIDQRGTGFSGADFDCGEFDVAIIDILAAEAAEAGAVATEAFDTCARRLADNPMLDTATTHNHAQDVVSVMSALGYERYVVYGVSYGSTIGLELLRTGGPELTGVVLDGVYPPDIDVDAALAESSHTSLDALAAACSASTSCSTYTGDVAATTETLIQRLDREPLVINLTSRESGFAEPIDVVLDGTRLAEFSFLLLYSEATLRYLPAILGGIEAGNESAARWLASVGTRTMVASYAANDEGTFFAVQCNDRLPFTDGPGEDLAPFPAAMTSAPLIDSCSAWDQPGAAEVAGEAVTSEIPTLLLSGQFDPITPAVFAERTAERLSNSTVVTQAGRGHGIWVGNDCIASIVLEFVSDPDAELDTMCAAQGVPVDWARP